jgi:nucleotide-binding universal stress UspA family protein
LSRALLGSIAEQVMRKAEAPVLLLRPRNGRG